MSMPTTLAPYSYTNITQPGSHDVMIGRGGGTNHNPGNIRFRQLICTRKDEYKSAKRSQKPIIAQEIVSAWRAQVPPGRFLKQDESTMLWYDVGNEEAKVKAAQKLRDSNKDNSWTNNKVEPKDENSKKKKKDREKKKRKSSAAIGGDEVDGGVEKKRESAIDVAAKGDELPKERRKEKSKKSSKKKK